MSRVDAQAAAAAVVFMDTPRGGELSLDPGRQVVARVVATSDDGTARISLAGQEINVTTAAQLRAGDDVRLTVTRADATGVRLTIVPPDPQTALPVSGAGSGGATASLVSELARAGVPVTPQIAQAAARVAEQIGGDSAAARAVANLAARDLVLSPAAAGRVATALDLAGALGPSLASLAARSSEVAAALPGGAPSADALRSLLAPALSSTEVAVARIVQATQDGANARAAAPGGPVTLPTTSSSSTSVIKNYVASQVAATTRLDDIATSNTVLGSQTAAPAQTPPPAGAGSGLAAAALQAAVRGQGAAQTGTETGSEGRPGSGALPAPALAAASPAAPGPAATPAAGSTATPAGARAGATAAAATGAASAQATPTSTPAAGAIADLATLAMRFAPAVASGAGGLGANASEGTLKLNAAAAAQQSGAAGAVAPGAASVAGTSASGDPAPIVTALQTFLASPGAEGDAARLMRSLAGATPNALTQAIRTLPESQSLQLAGQLLDLLPHGSHLAGTAANELRHGVHSALERLGHALVPPGSDDVTALRAALEHVAANDPRPAVASDAARLLGAVDGQQILSRTATGADPGYVYFQVPMPDGRGAEVLVRREPGRRAVSFDEFNIAFLLDTERIGTLLIELDAHPAGIRADVKTDIPELEPYLRERTEALMEPLARESRRPVTVTTGVFEQEPPSSLLEPQLGLLNPGTNEFYA